MAAPDASAGALAVSTASAGQPLSLGGAAAAAGAPLAGGSALSSASNDGLSGATASGVLVGADGTTSVFVARFQTTKHSWKGKYKRIFSVADNCVATVNPGTWEVTNRWAYNDEFVDAMPSPKSPQEFTIVVRKKKATKTETLTFSSQFRGELLTFLQRYRAAFILEPKTAYLETYPARKLGWNGGTKPTNLIAGFAAIDQINTQATASGAPPVIIASYNYREIERIEVFQENVNGFVIYCGGYGRMHLFSMDNRDEFLRRAKANATTYIGLTLNITVATITREAFDINRLGKYKDDEAITSLAEFRVNKLSDRHPDPAIRILCLTEKCIAERDPASYAIVTIRPLSDVFALVRYRTDPQRIAIEYKPGHGGGMAQSGAVRRYTSTDREALLASLLDGVRASGNRDVCVKFSETGVFNRVGPWSQPVEEEIQVMYLKSLAIFDPTAGISFDQLVSRGVLRSASFIVNIDYSGLNFKDLIDSKERELVHGALNSVLNIGQASFEKDVHAATEQFECLRRLLTSKSWDEAHGAQVGYEAFTAVEGVRAKLGKRIIQALKMNDDGVHYAAIDVLGCLMQPMHNYYDLVQEQLNKRSLLTSRPFLTNLVNVLGQHAMNGTGALVMAALLDFFTFALCEPYSQTTDKEHFDMLLEMVAGLGRKFFKLFQHPSLAIVKGAGLLMRTIIEEAPDSILQEMQMLSLSEGAILKHLQTSIFTQSTDNRMLTHRTISRQLVELWTADNQPAEELLNNIFPAGLMVCLDSKDVPPEDDAVELDTRDKKAGSRPKRQTQLEVLAEHWRNRTILNFEKPKEKVQVVLREKHKRQRTVRNWLMLYYQLARDHSRPDLIWNHKTREELREALESELRGFNIDKETGGNREVAWNYVEFEVRYESLADELKIGDHYVRLLLEQGVTTTTVRNPHEFFFDLYHRFLLATNNNLRSMSLQAMAIVYGAYARTIGPFNDMRFMVKMLSSSQTRLERDRYLIFIDKVAASAASMHMGWTQLLYLRENAREFIANHGVRVLCDMLTLAHLHVQRAQTPLQTMLIEGGDIARDNAKEWYYSNTQGEKTGPIGFDELRTLWENKQVTAETKFWAQGMDGWRKPHENAQLKWTLMIKDSGILNESEVAGLCLNMLIRMCEMYPSRHRDGAIIRPLPKIKRLLSEPTCLPHLANLFLTFDPILVERTATLLVHIIEENPIMPKVYLTGAFIFAMMYTGSNILPLAKFLEVAHTKQAFRTEEEHESTPHSVVVRSVLGPLLPTAMLCYLENYGGAKFAEVFLGDFDTPEVIWSHEMRRFMVEKIAMHLSEFSPRLLSNTHALYQYCPMPKIMFPELEHELFCNIYYLRHLCDTAKFPKWEIKNPVGLLKDILDEWNREVEKKAPSMSADDAYSILGITKEKAADETAIRKVYFKLANKYHPDKNPDGREMFEKVNKAYEFLVATGKTLTSGPDPQRIILLLRAQTILFTRYADVLKPYKYSGYPMLIKTIQMETHDDMLFSRAHPLLPAASELAFHTVDVSALNAEELRRENGLEVVGEAFTRCIDVIGSKTTEAAAPTQVCMFLVRLLASAASFDRCRERIIAQPRMVANVSRCLYIQGAPRLTHAAVTAVAAFAIDATLQNMLVEVGALWHILPPLFKYDYTLAEGGVQASTESNRQEIANANAALALQSLARLGGYLPRNEESPPEVLPSFVKRPSPAEQAAGMQVAVRGAPLPGVVDAPVAAPTQAVIEEWKKDRYINGIEMETPVNPRVRKALQTLLTPYLTKQLSQRDPAVGLKLLNSNTESPLLIWNNGIRAELLDFVQSRQERALKGEPQLEDLVGDFAFSDIKPELMIGDVYVRIFNEQPSFILDSFEQFTVALLTYLRRTAEILYKKMTPETEPSVEPRPVVLDRTLQSLKALYNVFKIFPDGVSQTINRYKVLFYFFRVDESPEIQQATLAVVHLIVANKDCVANMAEASVMQNLIVLGELVPASIPLLLEVLQILASYSKLVAEMLSKGALIYLLNIFCNSTNSDNRQGAAAVFSKLIADKLHGPRITLQLAKFLPSIFMDAMRDNAEGSIIMFENSHENPELVWDDAARRKVQKVVGKMTKIFLQEQLTNPNAKFVLPDDFEPVYGTVEGQLYIGGVFVKLFIKQPNWGLRNPKEFCTALLESFVVHAKPTAEEEPIGMIGQAFALLLSTQPTLIHFVASIGLVGKILGIMNVDNANVLRGAITIVHSLVQHQPIVDYMATVVCIAPIMTLMSRAPNCLGLAAETLKNLFERQNPEKGSLVRQALDANLVPFVLGLLDKPLNIDNQAAIKAQLVNALKAMARDAAYGEAVQRILDDSSVWAAFRDQRHDLFLTQATVKGLLTGPTSGGTKGYLTAAPAAVTLPTAPPPMDD